jgi:GNAT superfamily N-acetyltransferase
MNTSIAGQQAWKITPKARATDAAVMPLVYEGVSELAQDGYLVGKGLPFPVDPTDTVIYAVSPDEDLIGVLCYRRNENEIKLNLCYVEPSSRRQGVLRALWEELRAQEDKGFAILVRTDMAPENKIGRAVCEALGFVRGYAGWARLLQDVV